MVGVLCEVNNDFVVPAGLLPFKELLIDFAAADGDDDADGFDGDGDGLHGDDGFWEVSLLGRRVRIARNNSSLSSRGASAMICCNASTRCNTSFNRWFWVLGRLGHGQMK